MAFENWKRFASGVKGNGLQRVQQSKKNGGKGKKSSTTGSHRSTIQKAKAKKKKSQGSDQAEIPRIDSEWRADNDAHLLIAATEILESPVRLKMAKKVTEKKARKAMEVADNIKKL